MAKSLSDDDWKSMNQTNRGVFLSRESSDALKGVLMLLVALGHNHVLCPNTVAGGWAGYLYTFHVAGFFILPFFYRRQARMSWAYVRDLLVRHWVPYAWVCLLCWLAYSVFSWHFSFGWEHVWAFLQGTQSPIRQHFGFVFPWFLPTYCSFSLLLLVARRWTWARWTLLTLALPTLGMTWMQFYQFKNAVPFGMGLALYYYGLGELTRLLNGLGRWARYVGGALFWGVSVCWWTGVSCYYLYVLQPVCFFCLLLCVEPFLKMGWLRMVGRYSLGIYLFHVFIANLAYYLFPRTLWMGWLGFGLSVVVSLMLTRGIHAWPWLRKRLFPNTWEEFKSID